jgi:hypothetical protein
MVSVLMILLVRDAVVNRPDLSNRASGRIHNPNIVSKSKQSINGRYTYVDAHTKMVYTIDARVTFTWVCETYQRANSNYPWQTPTTSIGIMKDNELYDGKIGAILMGRVEGNGELHVTLGSQQIYIKKD